LLNFSPEPAELAFSLPESFSALSEAASLEDLFNGESVTLEAADGSLKVAVPGYGVRILADV
jgi:hypothetical protein